MSGPADGPPPFDAYRLGLAYGPDSVMLGEAHDEHGAPLHWISEDHLRAAGISWPPAPAALDDTVVGGGLSATDAVLVARAGECVCELGSLVGASICAATTQTALARVRFAPTYRSPRVRATVPLNASRKPFRR